MSGMVAPAKKAWTEAELQSLPSDGYKYELVDGELAMSPKNNFEHESLCGRLFLELATFSRAQRLGAVLGSNLGCWMENRNCRAPDISFISKARLRQYGFKPSTRRFFPAAPDLAVEIVSPSNTREEINDRLKDFFSSGTRLAWVIHPDEQYVEVCHSPTERQMIAEGGALDGVEVLPGFSYPIANLFSDWEWD